MILPYTRSITKPALMMSFIWSLHWEMGKAVKTDFPCGYSYEEEGVWIYEMSCVYETL